MRASKSATTGTMLLTATAVLTLFLTACGDEAIEAGPASASDSSTSEKPSRVPVTTTTTTTTSPTTTTTTPLPAAVPIVIRPSVVVNGSGVTVSGTVDLPDGAILYTALERGTQTPPDPDTGYFTEDFRNTTVTNKQFSSTLRDTTAKVRDLANAYNENEEPANQMKVFDEVRIVVSFSPREPGQPQPVIDAAGGYQGIALEKSPQVTKIGDLTNDPYFTINSETRQTIPYGS